MSYIYNKKTYVSLGFFLLLMVGLHHWGLLKPLENFTRSAFRPLLSWSHKTKVTSVPVDVVGTATAALKQENDLLKYQVNILKQENDELKKQVDYKSSQRNHWLTATVLGHSLDNMEKTIIIDRGAMDGVKINQPVITGNGVLVGKVAKTEDNSAIIRLASDSQFKISGMIINKSNSTGIVEGGYGLSLRLKFIPRNEIVTVGDVVVTAGLDPQCPRGLLIGNVAVVENEAYKPFQQAVLTPAQDADHLLIVSVLIDN